MEMEGRGRGKATRKTSEEMQEGEVERVNRVEEKKLSRGEKTKHIEKREERGER